MKKFGCLSSYSAIAALVLSLGVGTAPAHAGNLPTLVQLQAEPVATQSPIVLAAIDKIAKSATDRPLSKNEKKALKKLAKIENQVNALKDKLNDPNLSAAEKAKIEQKLADKTNKLIVAQQKVQLAEAKADKKAAERELRQATNSRAPEEELDKLRKAVKDAKNKVEQQKQDVRDARNGEPVDRKSVV